MVTLANNMHPLDFRGKSTDTKPKKSFGDYFVKPNDTFLEENTGKVFYFDETLNDWAEMGSD